MLEKGRCTLKTIFIKMGICQGLGGLGGLSGLRVAFSLVVGRKGGLTAGSWRCARGQRENSLTQLSRSTLRTHSQIHSSAPWLQGSWLSQSSAQHRCVQCPSGHGCSSPALSRDAAARTGEQEVGMPTCSCCSSAAPLFPTGTALAAA